jgi:hypothetical protein
MLALKLTSTARIIMEEIRTRMPTVALESPQAMLNEVHYLH